MELTNVFIKFNPKSMRYNIEVYSGPNDDNTTLDFEMSLFALDLDKVAAYILQEAEIKGDWLRLAKLKGTKNLFIVLEGKYYNMMKEIIERYYPEAIEYIYNEDNDDKEVAEN